MGGCGDGGGGWFRDLDARCAWGKAGGWVTAHLELTIALPCS
jgi:hypothetical protein